MLFFNRGNFNAVDEGQLLAAKRFDRFIVPGVCRIGVASIERVSPVIGVFLKYDFRAAYPLLEYVWAGEPNEDAQRMLEAIEAALTPDAGVRLVRLIEMPQEMFRYEDGVLEAGFSHDGVPPPDLLDLLWAIL